LTGLLQTQSKSSRSKSSGDGALAFLQRKCACGGSAGGSGQCEECASHDLALQRYPVTRSSLVRSVASQTLTEHSSPRLARASVGLQRFPASSREASGDGVASALPANPTQEGDAAGARKATAGLLIEDDASPVAAHQMRKSAFLDELKSTVCAAADAELVEVGRNTKGCPYIETWIGYYRGRSAQQIERSLHRYAPEARRVASAREYMPVVAGRIKRAVSVWARTGQITDVPDELAGRPGAGLGGVVGGVLSGIGSTASGLAGGIGRAVGGIFAKSLDGGSKNDSDPEQIQGQLRSGKSLDPAVRSRMESAFGHDFSRVRIHADSSAADVANSVNARAFTIGNDIAFANNEYRPGSIIGDALLAHELAHVVQQGAAGSNVGLMHKAASDDDALEEEADRSAVSAVVSLWGGARQAFANIADNAMPSLRSGLRLQRCPAQKTPQTPAMGGTKVSGTTTQPESAPGAGPPDPCGGTAKATSYTPVAKGPFPAPTLLTDEFGKTPKYGAAFTFGACKVADAWRFYLMSLTVQIDSAVQPDGFRTDVTSASDSVVTSTSYPDIIKDLQPKARVKFHPGCGATKYDDQVSTYSWRKTYWKRQLVVEHEGFHRTDWDAYYRPELIKAEQNVWAHSIPAPAAATATDAVATERKTLDGLMAAAYMPACSAYAPQEESRAYDHGAPAYQQLVDDIQARADKEGWSKQGGQGQKKGPTK